MKRKQLLIYGAVLFFLAYEILNIIGYDNIFLSWVLAIGGIVCLVFGFLVAEKNKNKPQTRVELVTSTFLFLMKLFQKVSYQGSALCRTALGC
jgi:uncharacterized membrane protein